MSSNHFRDAALDAAGRGWAVFPLRPAAKTPAIATWPQFATTDPCRIHRWWPENSRYNIAIATGPSGLYVIDIDTHEDPNPLVRLSDRLGHAVPSTFTVRTPRGTHLYFQAPAAPEARRCTVGRIAPGIDTRGDGGYILAPGSATPIGRYRIIDPRPPAALPDWLINRLTPPPPPIRAGAPTHPSAYLEAIVASEVYRVTHAVKHFRNHTLFRAAITLGRLVGGGHLTEGYARRVLTAAAAPHIGNHNFTAAELDRTVTNGLTIGAQHPRHLASNTNPGGPQ